MVHLLQLALKASVLLLVLALGMRATPADATYLFRRPSKLILALVSLFVVVPLVAAVLTARVAPALPVRIALLAMAVSPVAPILPGKQLKFGGREGYVYGLLVAVSALAAVLTPLSLEALNLFFPREGHFGVVQVAKLVATTILLPLAAGMAVRSMMPRLAEWAGPWASRLGTALLLIGALPLLLLSAPAVLSLLGDGSALVIAVTVLAGILAGHWLAGPDPRERTALAFASSMRHPSVALGMASANFPEEKLVPAAILLYLLVGVLATSLYGALVSRRFRGASNQGDADS